MSVDLHVQEPYLSLIRSGLKSVEGRLAKEKFTALQPGSKVRFNGELEMEVVAVRIYPSFREMLECEGLDTVLPGINTIEEGAAVYSQFYSAADEERLGVAAIKIRKCHEL